MQTSRKFLLESDEFLTKISAAALADGTSDRGRDSALMMRVTAGDVGALRSIYEEQAPRAMAIAFRILNNMEEAEDVVQETFLELWRRSSQFEAGRGAAVAWVVTIARSRAIDRFRAAKIAGRDIGTAVASGELMPTALPSPADQAEGRRDKSRVTTALCALPAEQRETIELAYFAGLSQSEIAAKTETPLGTVKMRVQLAIKKLTRLLKEEDEK